MKLKIMCFGITKDILGAFETEIELAEGSTNDDLKNQLMREYPALERLKSLRIAVNGEYAEEPLVLKPNHEIVLIPPVSGG